MSFIEILDLNFIKSVMNQKVQKNPKLSASKTWGDPRNTRQVLSTSFAELLL